MRIPLSWLDALTPIPGKREELPERLTAAGLECALEGPPTPPPGVITGKIVACEKHPNADRLTVCTVDVGDGRERSIVCGAPNAKAGPVGCVALPGTGLAGFTIEERKLRGVTSEGMLCSSRELGLSDEHEGILLLPEDTEIGVPLGEILTGEGVLVTEPTSNRGDTMSVVGTAREVCAVGGQRLELTPVKIPKPDGDGGWAVTIEDPADCPRYAGRVVEGLTAGPSPEWMARRLEAAGVRPLLNLVDVTNYVLLERGHPLHAFDVAKLTGKTIGVRRSTREETLRTLDGKDRETGEGTLLITDEAGPIAAGGVMGGEATMVSESTTSVFLEGASFAASRVRAGARAMKLTSDASARFERGVDPEGVADALDRCVELLLEICPGARYVHAVDEYPAPPEPRKIGLRRKTLRRILGIDPDPAEVRGIFASLQIEIADEKDEGWTVVAPTFRPDLLAEEDLIEEVGRIHGYDRIPERRQIHASANRVRLQRVDDLRRGRHTLLSLGLTEVVTPSLIDGAREASVVAGDEWFSVPIALRNPLSQDRGHLRGSLAPSLLTVLATNRARSTSDLAIFEIGRVFSGDPDLGLIERQRAGLLLSGHGLAPGGVGPAKSCDFFDMKGLVEVYVEQFWGASLRLEASAPAPLDPARSAAILVDGVLAGHLGEIGPEARGVWDLPPDLPVLVAELDLDARLPEDRRDGIYSEVPRYPGVLRDLAFVAPPGVTHADLESALRESGGPLLAEVGLFDVYEGAPLAEGERSLAYELVFRSSERSLKSEEVDGLVEKIVGHVHENHGARIR
jgi:phenylalanyl-tRNA synthetase beta chain